MPTIKDAIIVLVIVLGCCVFISLGAFLEKKLTLGKLARISGIVALIAIILYVIYVAWVLFTT
jgi:hypothetical protein